ncbi:unnamed protein product [Penicillium viridicatum]
MQSMFYFDGKLIPEPEYDPRQINNWVNVFIQARDSDSDDETLMRTVAAYIRTSTASISVHAKHHDHPLCPETTIPTRLLFSQPPNCRLTTIARRFGMGE